LKKSKAVLEILPFEGPREPTDKYGFKRMLEKTRKYAFCPDCDSPLVFKDETREILICPKCGFEKPNILPEDWDELEPIDEWVVRKQKEQESASKK